MKIPMLKFAIVEEKKSGEESIYSFHRSRKLAEERFNKDFIGTDRVLCHKILPYCDDTGTILNDNKQKIFDIRKGCFVWF